MQGYKRMGLTGFDLFIGDELSTSLRVRADMHMYDRCSADANRSWLLSVCEVPCGIAIFCFHYRVSPAAHQILSMQ